MPRLRPARDADHGVYLRYFAELGVDDPPVGVARWRSEMVGSSFVIEDEGQAVGYALVQILEATGYLRQIVVDAGSRRRGLGRFAMHALAERFREAGCRRWCLNVKPDNRPAVGLYRDLGMVEHHRSVSLRLRWSSLEGQPAAPVRCDAPTGEQIQLAEQAFGLPSGLLASMRARAGAVLRVARRPEPSAPHPLVGLACFEPHIGGCFPFRAEDLPTAIALLRAMRPHADPRREHLQVVVEDMPLLVVKLEQIGAWRVLEFAHYSGEI